MAGRTRAARVAAQPSPPTNAVVASSAHYRGSQAPKQYGTDKPWQERCYTHYAKNGVARYAARYYGNALSKCAITLIEDVVSDSGTPGTSLVTGKPENASLGEMFAGQANQGQMLDAIGVHLTIAGECFVVGRSQALPEGAEMFTTEEPPKIWEVLSPLEMSVLGEKWTIRYDGYPDIVLTDDDDVIRVWRPNPRHRLLADSPFKSLLNDLDEIEQLTLHTFSQIRSRLINAGILFLSENMKLPKKPAKQGEEQELSGADAFMLTLAELMEAAITNQGSPAANIPLIVQVPDDTIDKTKLLTFWSDLDQQTMPMKSAAIHRFAMGMDLPNEMVEGMASNPGTGGGASTGVSHWGAWQIEESAIKVHIEPMLALIANSFTVDYLRVVHPGTKYRAWYSTEGLKLRPDRSREALELYALGLISIDAVLRENGFTDGDKMDDKEKREWLIVKIASGSNTPEQVAAAAKILGVDLPTGDPEPVDTNEARPVPSLVDHPSRPRTPAEQPAAALVTACHVMVLSALRHVGNRLVQQGIRPPGVETFDVHCFAEVANTATAEKLLEKAFPMSAEILDGLADPADVMPALKAYTMSRIVTRTAHKREDMLSWLGLTAA